MEIKYNNKVAAIIDNIATMPLGLSFLGLKTDPIQVGTFRYDRGKLMRDHYHIINPRQVDRTQEILIVFSGKCEVRLSAKTDKGYLVMHTGILSPLDYCIVYDCGVGYTILQDDTKLMEIKVGPYTFNNDDQDRELIH